MDFGFHDELIEYRTHYRWAFIVVCLAFVVLTGRFLQLQVLEGEQYETLAAVSHVVRDRLVPTRGSIRGRSGEVLAMDVEVTDLMVVPQYVKDPEAEVGRLVDLSVLDAEGSAEVLGLIQRAKTTEQRLHRLVARKGLTGSRCPYDLVEMNFDQGRGRMVCPKCGRALVNEAAVIQSHLFDLPGFSLKTRRVRHYPGRSLVAHSVGFVNEATQTEVDSGGGRLKAGDLVGRSGLERAMDECLRGQPGEDVYVRSATGQRIALDQLPEPFRDEKGSMPVRGCDVTITIDMALQAAALDVLEPYPSGAIVAMDVDTGEVLAMASRPTFDPEPALPDPKSERQAPDPFYAPQMNKAVTAFPPGSVFKPITAVAGLNEAIVSEETKTFCPGFYEYKGRRFKCHKRYGHAKVALREAISRSCDVYFYQVGEQLGIDNLAHYGRDVFGLGERTGVELGESSGMVPTERWYRRHGQYGLQPGFALNTAVGQGDVKATPLQLARAYAALVNGGRLLRPRLVAEVRTADGHEVVMKPEVQRVLDLPEDYVEQVMAGLHDAVNDDLGTAYQSRIKELPYAGKTGTAQARETRKGATSAQAAWLLQDHAWFVAYAPSKKPRMVIVTFIEHGGFGGHVAAPVARKVIEAYYAEHADEFADQWERTGDDVMLEIVR